MYCAHCHSEVKPGWKACPVCAKRLPEVITCKSCGEQLKPTWRVCPQFLTTINDRASSISISDSVVKEVHQISIHPETNTAPIPKWKPKAERNLRIPNIGEYQAYRKLASFQDKPFCPECGEFDSLDIFSDTIGIKTEKGLILVCIGYECVVCKKRFLGIDKELMIPAIEGKIKLDGSDETQVYSNLPISQKKVFCPECGSCDSLEIQDIGWHLYKTIGKTDYFGNLQRAHCLSCGQRSTKIKNMEKCDWEHEYFIFARFTSNNLGRMRLYLSHLPACPQCGVPDFETYDMYKVIDYDTEHREKTSEKLTKYY